MAGRKVRVYFEKRGDARFLSQLDLHRAVERAIRRSRLKVDFTEGFNPHVRISLPPAAPVGVETTGDCFAIRVDPEHSVEEIETRLAEQCAHGIRIVRIEEGPAPPDGRCERLSIDVTDGHAAAEAVATALRQGGDVRFSRAVARGAAVIIELSGAGAEHRPPRVRECVQQAEELLRALGFSGGTGAVVRHGSGMPAAPA